MCNFLLFLNINYVLIFFLSEIWLDWLKDEIKMASEISEREKVYELFERAVKDYICKSFRNALK